MRARLRLLWNSKTVLLRSALCLAVGVVFLVGTEKPNHDLRFEIRPSQSVNPNIVIVSIPEQDWGLRPFDQRKEFNPIRGGSAINDDYFWQKRTWLLLLKKILAQNPKKIGVTFYFDQLPTRLPSKDLSVFQDKRVYWSADLDSRGRVLLPGFAILYGKNTGVCHFPVDADSRFRRFNSGPVQIPHLAQRLSNTSHLVRQNRVVNFAGPAETYPHIDFQDVLNGQVNPSEFTGKIVVIGAQNSRIHEFLTPVGKLSRAEITANLVDNMMDRKWIRSLPTYFYAGLLILILLVSIAIQFYYPKAISIVLIFWLATAVSAFSAWVFDVHFLWIPVAAPLIQISVTYLLFLSYQLTLAENRSWQLEKEQESFYAVEKLKNNFVSLISHDLKTPIAKIQAICDRLLATSPNPELTDDLRNLRRSSDELHRYIKSILRVTRVESRDFKIRKEVADINEIVEKIVTQLQPLAREKNITIITDLEPMFAVELDTGLIEEVVLNLVENAVKYTGSGGRITIVSKESDDKILISVEDTGVGISERDQIKIWDKFFRSKEISLQTTGSGLGLYLVKYFVELHGGNVFLKSRLGQGTKVGFNLPVLQDETEQFHESLNAEIRI